MRALILVATTLALAGCSSGGGDGDPIEQPPAAVRQVSIHGGDFDPRSITMAAGETLYFESHEEGPHTATASGAGLDSGDLGMNEGHSFPDMRPGTYQFTCRHHGHMSTTVTVTG